MKLVKVTRWCVPNPVVGYHVDGEKFFDGWLEQIKPAIAADLGRFVMNRNILFIPIRILSILLLFYIPICSAEFNWKPDYISIGLGE